MEPGEQCTIFALRVCHQLPGAVIPSSPRYPMNTIHGRSSRAEFVEGSYQGLGGDQPRSA